MAEPKFVFMPVALWNGLAEVVGVMPKGWQAAVGPYLSGGTVWYGDLPQPAAPADPDAPIAPVPGEPHDG